MPVVGNNAAVSASALRSAVRHFQILRSNARPIAQQTFRPLSSAAIFCTPTRNSCSIRSHSKARRSLLNIGELKQTRMYSAYKRAADIKELGPLVSVEELQKLIKEGLINRDWSKEGTIRVLDCSFKAPKSKPDHAEYQNEWFAQWDKLINKETEHRAEYEAEKIPGAIHIDIGHATYPSEHEHYALYPAEMFQEYVRKIGLNSDDHFICYDRGGNGGMVYATRMFWIFRTYGHDNVSVLNGGYHAWIRHGYDVSAEKIKVQPGNWTAHLRPEMRITYEELVANGMPKHGQGVNMVDTRPSGQFTGEADTGFGPDVPGHHLPDSINLPAKEVVAEDGLLKSQTELQKYLNGRGLVLDLPIISYCNTGMNASLGAFALYVAHYHLQPDIRLYFGSLKEIESRDPKHISGKLEQKE